MTPKPTLFVVGLPVGAMITWLMSLVIAVSQGHEVILPVSGYDPRDLLSGHYLRYRVEYGVLGFYTLGSKDLSGICVCLTQGDDGIAQATWSGPCSERDSSTCPIFIKGRNRNRLEAGIERYYIPERYQHSLARIPPKATIKVRVTKNGTAYVTDMYVDGVPILEWAKQHS